MKYISNRVPLNKSCENVNCNGIAYWVIACSSYVCEICGTHVGKTECAVCTNREEVDPPIEEDPEQAMQEI